MSILFTTTKIQKKYIQNKKNVFFFYKIVTKNAIVC